MNKKKFDEFFKDSHFKGDGYWYLKLSAKFFDDAIMYEMLNIPIYGKTFFVIFLKLCVRSLDRKGYIKIPKYFPEGNYIGFIATDIKESPQEVELAINYFIEKELIEIFKSDKETLIYFPIVENNTGKSSKDADRKRLERKKRRDFLLSKDKTLLLEPAEVEPLKVYGKFSNVYLREREFEELQNSYEDLNGFIDGLSIDKEFKIIQPENDYKYLTEELKKEGKKR